MAGQSKPVRRAAERRCAQQSNGASAGVPDLGDAGPALAVRAGKRWRIMARTAVTAVLLTDPAAIDGQAKEERSLAAVGATAVDE